MNGTDCLTPQQLRALLAGELSVLSTRAAAQHIESCSACSATARQIDSGFESVLLSLREPTAILVQRRELAGPATIGPDPYQTRVDPDRAASEYPFLARPLGDELGRLGPYRVLGLLGAGGMAFIFRAEDTSLHRPVALKVMKPALAADREGCIRFLREAQVMAAIQHDHVATVHQVGQDGETVFLAMELLSGETLDSWMQRTPRPVLNDVVRIGKEIASGLSIVHEHGVVHRDLKPSNVWMKRKETDPPERFQVKILDFGLAGLLKSDADLTKSGIALGTPAYMSPEQARGTKVDARSDLFSLGCILYELCAGRKPFADDHTMAALTSLAMDTPASVHELNSAVPVTLSDLIDDLLEKNPEDRPASAHAVFERLCSLEQELSGGEDTLAIRPASKRRARASRRSAARRKSGWWTTKRLVAAAFIVAAAAGAAGFGVVGWSRKGIAEPKPAKVDVGVKYLAELEWFDKQHWPFVHGGDKKGKKKKDDGKKDFKWGEVRVDGRVWPRGIFMHPPAPPDDGQPASLSYKLDKQFKRFKTEVTINEGLEAWAPQWFSVYGDGEAIWRSKAVLSNDDRQQCDIPIERVDVLKIEVVCHGIIEAAHAVWLDPRVVP